MTRSLKNKLSLAAAVGSLFFEYRGKRKLALGLSLLAAGLQWDPTPEQKQKALDFVAKVLPETEPTVTEGENLSSAEISSAVSSSRLMH